MKEMSIYTATSIRGRWNKDGYIGYTLEYYPKDSKYPRTLTDFAPVEDMNENRAEITALYQAFSRIRENCVVSIYTESEYIFQALSNPGHIDKWIRNGWKTANGTEIKNRDLWQQLIGKIQGNMYQVMLKQNNAYTGVLIMQMEEKEKMRYV